MNLLESTPPVEFNFDVYSPLNPMVREQHGVVCSLDIRDVLQRAWSRQQGEDIPAQNCYVESICLEDATNTFPCDMFLTCRQSDRIGGTFARAKLCGDDASHNPEHSLWVIHTGDKFAYPDGGRKLYSAQDFVEGKTFRAYSKMLESG